MGVYLKLICSNRAFIKNTENFDLGSDMRE